jgi:hypothetical protein
MTVATTLNKITYAGTGGTTSFPFSYAFPGGVTTSQAALDLVVTFVSTAGVATVIAFGPNTNQYQLTLNAAVSPNPTGVGGIVTYNPGGIPIAIGTTLTIQRILPEIQGTSYQNQGTLWQTVVEQSLDYLTMMVQQIQATFGNFIQAPQTDPVGLNYTVPTAAQRANLALIFDSSGNVTAGASSSVAVSAPMIPVVQAASLSVARTALGLGAMATEGIGGGLQDDGASNARVFFPVTALAVTTTITSAHFLNKIKTTGPITLNLNRANTYWTGFGFWVENLNPGGIITITVNAADQIETIGSGVSYLLNVGDSIYICTNAASSGTWFVELTQGTTASGSPPGVYSNLIIKVASGTTVTASANFASVSDGTNFYTIVPSATINAATTGLNGLDTGSLAIDSWYAVWAIYNPVTQVAGWILSLQFTANGTFLAALPSGFKAYGRYGAVQTIHASATFYGTWQLGRKAQYVQGLAGGTPVTTTTPGPIASGVVGTYSSASPTLVAKTVVGGGFYVPVTASHIQVTTSNDWKALGGCQVQVAPSQSYSGANNGPAGTNGLAWPFENDVAGTASLTTFWMLLETTTISVAMNSVGGAGGMVTCLGWEDNI